MVTCEFNQGSKMNPVTGRTEHNVLCGKPAAQRKCEGELTSLVMPLCEFHTNFVMTHYKWKVKTVTEEKNQLGHSYDYV